MKPLLAIHTHGQPEGFAPGWISFCEQQGLEYRLVDCFGSDIIDTLRGCDALLWYFDHNQYCDLLVARHILHSIAKMGIKVFPDFNSAWHFDDKIAQKYIFESYGLPHVATHCFYFEREALDWIDEAAYPFVWKLRGGAGATNVRLVQDKKAAVELCKTAFGPGFNPVPADFRDFKNRIRKISSLSDFWSKLKRRPALIMKNRRRKLSFPPEVGYFLAQDFIPGNTFDTRVTVINGISWAFTRGVRKNDFRASGSGNLNYDPKTISWDCLDIARKAARVLDADCIAFDFITHPQEGAQIVEMSYAFMPDAVANCPGYWDQEGNWCDQQLRPEDVMVKGLLERLAENQ